MSRSSTMLTGSHPQPPWVVSELALVDGLHLLNVSNRFGYWSA